MNKINGIPIWGNPIDEGALSQIQTCARTADYVALMADHHKGYAVPIGGVVAYYDKISPSGVGFDIACGNKAVRTDANINDVKRDIVKIMDAVWDQISFGIGQKNNIKVEHPLFDDDDPAWRIPEIGTLKQMAHDQLGTVGSGNHYVDIFSDELGSVWIGVHFGSRGLGHRIATFFLNKAGAKDGMDVEPCVLSATSDIGLDYLTAMQLAGRYAYAGRDWVCSKVAEILGASILEEVHNHHNFAWRERHLINGQLETLWVVRKGATPAFPEQKGFVGGSMGEQSVIIQGKPRLLQRLPGYVKSLPESESLYSTVHGAGRVMSRTAARGKTKTVNYWRCPNCNANERKLPGETNPKVWCNHCEESEMYTFHSKELISSGAVSLDMMEKWLYDSNVVLRGGGVDESPHCYKRLAEVLEYHKDSIDILHTLTPLGVAMAGENEYDPYKD